MIFSAGYSDSGQHGTIRFGHFSSPHHHPLRLLFVIIPLNVTPILDCFSTAPLSLLFLLVPRIVPLQTHLPLTQLRSIPTTTTSTSSWFSAIYLSLSTCSFCWIESRSAQPNFPYFCLTTLSITTTTPTNIAPSLHPPFNAPSPYPPPFKFICHVGIRDSYIIPQNVIEIWDKFFYFQKKYILIHIFVKRYCHP